MTQTARMPIQPGEAAPEFAVPSVQDDRTICLADYRGRAPLLLGLFPGLYCPFCRRALAQMAVTSEKLKPLGVDALAVVGTELDNARLYFGFRPTRLALGADPRLATHRSYGVPRPEPTPELMQAVEQVRINPTGEFPEPLPILAAITEFAKRDDYRPTATDERDQESNFTQLKGQFLIDRDGIVRWANIECGGQEGLSGFGKFPTQEELLSAARTVVD